MPALCVVQAAPSLPPLVALPMEKTLSRRSFQGILDMSSSALSQAQAKDVPEPSPPSVVNVPSLPPRRHRLFVTLNPSSETLCSGLALGIEAQGDTKEEGGGEARRVEQAVSMEHVKDCAALPHDVWIQVPLVREAIGWQVRGKALVC